MGIRQCPETFRKAISFQLAIRGADGLIRDPLKRPCSGGVMQMEERLDSACRASSRKTNLELDQLATPDSTLSTGLQR